MLEVRYCLYWLVSSYSNWPRPAFAFHDQISFLRDTFTHTKHQPTTDVFVYSPPGLEAEISTLIIRCLFPIHPLAAALQSIGVVKRDIEHDRRYQVGQIVFPGWILHGAFDFALMAYSQISIILHPDDDDDDTTNSTNTGMAPRSDNGEETEEELQSSAFMVSMVMLIPLIGILCYFKMAWAQRERLEVLDRQRGVAV